MPNWAKSEVITLTHSKRAQIISGRNLATASLLFALLLGCRVQDTLGAQIDPRILIPVGMAASGPTGIGLKCADLLSDRITLEDMKTRFTNRQISDRMVNLANCIGRLPRASVSDNLQFLDKSTAFHDAMAMLLTRAIQYINSNGENDNFFDAPITK